MTTPTAIPKDGETPRQLLLSELEREALNCVHTRYCMSLLSKAASEIRLVAQENVCLENRLSTEVMVSTTWRKQLDEVQANAYRADCFEGEVMVVNAEVAHGLGRDLIAAQAALAEARGRVAELERELYNLRHPF